MWKYYCECSEILRKKYNSLLTDIKIGEIREDSTILGTEYIYTNKYFSKCLHWLKGWSKTTILEAHKGVIDTFKKGIFFFTLDTATRCYHTSFGIERYKNSILRTGIRATISWKFRLGNKSFFFQVYFESFSDKSNHKLFVMYKEGFSNFFRGFFFLFNFLKHSSKWIVSWKGIKKSIECEYPKRNDSSWSKCNTCKNHQSKKCSWGSRKYHSNSKCNDSYKQEWNKARVKKEERISVWRKNTKQRNHSENIERNMQSINAKYSRSCWYERTRNKINNWYGHIQKYTKNWNLDKKCSSSFEYVWKNRSQPPNIEHISSNKRKKRNHRDQYWRYSTLETKISQKKKRQYKNSYTHNESNNCRKENHEQVTHCVYFWWSEDLFWRQFIVVESVHTGNNKAE